MKRKTANSEQRPTEHVAESSSGSQNASQGILYEEATGKTVDFIRYVHSSKGLSTFEVRFTDGTFLFIEPFPRLEFQVRLLKATQGNVRTIRDYGIVR